MSLASAPDQPMTPEAIRAELLRCAASPVYFVRRYCLILDNVEESWIPFDLWDAQADVLELVHMHQLLVALKARQIGITWLALAYALWSMLFAPIANVLLFSKRQDEAIHLLDERLKGMYRHLPAWMQSREMVIDNKTIFQLANGSTARAFPSNAGDSYSATLAVIDEADLVPNLNALLRSVRPTIDAGGKLFLLSRVDKNKPNSEFKKIYRGAKAGKNHYTHIFLPWHVHPERDRAWFAKQCEDYSEDDRKEQYPETDAEALEPRKENKRIPGEWLLRVYADRDPLPLPPDFPAIPDVRLYRLPERGMSYVGGVDCAEGLPTSDDSVTIILDRLTQEQVCVLAGKISTDVHADYSARLAQYYNRAPLMIENNNHGHSFILWLKLMGHKRLILPGHDNKAGWTSNERGKALMYDLAATVCKNGETLITDFETYAQLASIEKDTLRAPEGELDDLADAFALALEAVRAAPRRAERSQVSASGVYEP